MIRITIIIPKINITCVKYSFFIISALSPYFAVLICFIVFEAVKLFKKFQQKPELLKMFF